MNSDFEIGRVVAVDTAQITVQLHENLKALTQSTYEGVHEVGTINSYVILPVGARRLVGMVTRVVLAEEAEVSAERTMVTLPSARRLMKATLIGTIEGRQFTQGVASFPVLDNPVLLTSKKDLEVIFDSQPALIATPPPSDHPGYCIEIGKSAVFEEFQIKINPDCFFGKHAAILGSTGSGKSCTIASLLQSILEREEVLRTNVVILDTNGEYLSAFAQKEKPLATDSNRSRRCLHIPSDPTLSQQRLVIPYWFMNAEDFVRFFRASQGVQRPVLLEALRLARNESSGKPSGAMLRDELTHEMNRLWSLSGKDEKTSKDLRDLAQGLISYMEDQALTAAWQALAISHPKLDRGRVKQALQAVKTEAERSIDQGKYPAVIPADARQRIRASLEPIYSELTGASLGQAGRATGLSADVPHFFEKVRFRSQHLEQVLRREESGGARARDFCGTMMLRIDRLLADRRFDFLLGPTDGALPDAQHSLAMFIRDIFGLPSRENADSPLSDGTKVPATTLPFYDRQRGGTTGSNVVIIDLSLLAAEVLENVTALIGRLLLEFLQRLGEFGGEKLRGELPLVLVLEEAQNYIREQRYADEESISRTVFERIAREGRKFGLGMVVSSQRPSELSKTVLSQCSSFIVHRLQNPEDLRYFREIVPSVYEPLMAQVPSLAPQTALVLGEGVRAPALVRIRDANPVPRSKNPKFYRFWVRPNAPDVPVEEVCAKWEGKA